ncbi:MAG TPA: hypothetical protein VHN14_17045, partial [Kofleriaceae bacterium]|nr:hypothetical protein [Kofleriaceae bacterium]
MRSLSITSGSTPARYVDRKRWAWALSPVWICMPLMGIGLALATGVSAWNWLTLAVWYLVLPVADFLVGADTNNPPESAIEQLDQDSYYRILTYITVPVHYVIFIVAAWYAATQPMSALNFLGLTLSVGLING